MLKQRIQWTFPFVAVLALLAAVLFAVQDASAASQKVFTGLVKGVAVGGHDPVAYFSNGKPMRGKQSISFNYNGALWRFSSEANRSLFAADPAKYAPQYGGYCAWAVSQGYTAKGDPAAWSVVDGKLYLNYNLEVRNTWNKNIPGNIAKADANWPQVLEK